MKKLFVYRIKNNIFWNLNKIRFFQLLGYQVYIWGEHEFTLKNVIQIKFPSAIKSVEYEKESRLKISKYFKKFSNCFSSGDIYMLDYVRKSIDINALDYFVFERTISNLIEKDDKCKKIVPLLLNTIHSDLRPKRNYFVFFPYLLSLMKITFIWLKDIFMSLKIKKKVSSAPILFFRKKISPDNGEHNFFCSALNKKDNVQIRGIFPFSGSGDKKFGFYFFSSFKEASLISTKSYFCSLKSSLNDLLFYFNSGIDAYYLKRCIEDTYTAKKVVGLSPSIILGVLVDKPLYILMFKYKNDMTKMVSLNESFFFPPNRSFDYNHLDIYYSMNSIDESMQNRYGGNINSFKKVEFFRKGNHDLKGISKELREVMSKFNYKIVIAPAQVYVEKTGYYYWAFDEMESFLKTSLNLAKDFPDTLFIVKGKKGELKLLPTWFKNLERELENIFVVHCDKPKELEYNKFEDLIDEANLAISMALTSTTIWQTIARDKPAIAINRTKIPSPLSEFEGLECNLADLKGNIKYWKHRSPKDIINSINKLKKTFNIGSSNGLEQISKDLEKMLRLSNTI